MKKLVIAMLIALAGCAAVARSTYGLELDRCVEKAATRADSDQCIKEVQNEWTKAGAKPAATDAGVE